MPKYQVPKIFYETRANYFASNFNGIKLNPDFTIYKNAIIDSQWAQVVAEFYFLLNAAYKNLHDIEDDHKTEPSKIAALTALSICSLQLLRPKNIYTSEITNADTFKSQNEVMFNPLFAVRCACNRLSITIEKLSFEEADRLFRGLVEVSLVCTNNYLTDLVENDHELGKAIEFNLHDEDIRILEDKISLFHFLEIAVNGPLISKR